MEFDEGYQAWKKKQEENSARKKTETFEERYQREHAAEAKKAVVDSLTKWLNNSNAFVKNYNTRANGAKEGVYRSDSQEWLDRVTGEARRRLFDRDLRLTQSRIDCFETCPFQYYCKYILKLDEGDSAELKYGEVGTFVHYVLEHFMREAAEDGEGLQTMRTLARNMVFLMRSIALGKEQFGLPEKEEKISTHFIR